MNPEGMELSTEAHWYVSSPKGKCALCGKGFTEDIHAHKTSCSRCSCQAFSPVSNRLHCGNCGCYQFDHSEESSPHFNPPATYARTRKAPGSSHYQGMPGPEPIEVTKHMDFLRGNVVKYVMRAGRKGGPADERMDLEKATQYLAWAIEMLPAKGE